MGGVYISSREIAPWKKGCTSTVKPRPYRLRHSTLHRPTQGGWKGFTMKNTTACPMVGVMAKAIGLGLELGSMLWDTPPMAQRTCEWKCFVLGVTPRFTPWIYHARYIAWWLAMPHGTCNGDGEPQGELSHEQVVNERSPWRVPWGGQRHSTPWFERTGLRIGQEIEY